MPGAAARSVGAQPLGERRDRRGLVGRAGEPPSTASWVSRPPMKARPGGESSERTSVGNVECRVAGVVGEAEHHAALDARRDRARQRREAGPAVSTTWMPSVRPSATTSWKTRYHSLRPDGISQSSRNAGEVVDEQQDARLALAARAAAR